MWPQITYIVLLAIGVTFALAKHGEEREPHSFWWSLVGAGLSVWLLWAGGFFAVFS